MRNCLLTFSFILFIGSIILSAQEKKNGIDLLTQKIDSAVFEAIKQEAFPGCVIYALQKDRVIFLQSYGYHTYDSARRVAVNDIYDLASVTKAMGATLAMMKLYEDGKINLDNQIGNYIDGIGRKVESLTFREIMAHQAGLYPWIPFYDEIKRRNGKYKNKTVRSGWKEGYEYPLSDSLFLHEDFYKKIKRFIRKSDVSKEKKYRYSGLFFYLIPELVETLSSERYEDYLTDHFYDSLNAETVGFNPLNRFNSSQIVPTEIDTFFRHTSIHGVVHDEGAIMMKGISGNAGLFGNAIDVAKVWQMLLSDGTYDSVQYLRPQTIDLFTTTQYPNNDNRRGLGFDKPLLAYDSIISSVAKSASYRSYGHSGYTGTLVWADPENDLLFIFLSNRVYPSRSNTNLYKLNVRPTIHQFIYDYLEEKD
jgi:serine-type D-Ala-D-Ala carboxypeptidase